MMKSYPFDSKNLGSSSSPRWDRAITAEDERKFNKLYFTNGVFASPTTSLMVKPSAGMQVQVMPGGCHIEGAKAYNDSPRLITLSNSSSSLSRIDRIVARFDNSEAVRSIDLYVREGVPSTTPQPPELHRQSNYYEIALADILVTRGTTSISSSHITDQRLNPAVCGFVVPMAEYTDTSELWDQIKDSVNLVNEALNGTALNALNERLQRYAPKDSPTFTGTVNTGTCQYKSSGYEPSLGDNSGKMVSTRYLTSLLKNGISIKNIDFSITDAEYQQIMELLN